MGREGSKKGGKARGEGFNLAFLQTGSRVSQHPQPCPPHPRMLKKVLKIHHGHCKGIEQSRAEQSSCCFLSMQEPQDLNLQAHEEGAAQIQQHREERTKITAQ